MSKSIIYQSARHRIRRDGDKLLVEVRTNSDGVPWMPKTLKEPEAGNLACLVEWGDCALSSRDREFFNSTVASLLGEPND